MATLFFDSVKKIVRFVNRDVAPTKDTVILMQGEPNVRCNMAGGKYYIDIGKYKEAIVAQPVVIGERIFFKLTTHSLSKLGLDVYTVEIANALQTMKTSAYLHRLIWDYVGVPRNSTFGLDTAISVRIDSPLSPGRDSMRIIEGYFDVTKTFFFTTPASRSLAVVVRYRFDRDSTGKLTALIPERACVE